MATPKKAPPKKPAPAKAVKAKPAAKPVTAKAKPIVKAKVELKAKPAARRIEPPVARPAPRPRPERIEPVEPMPIGPQKPQVDAEWQREMRLALSGQRQRLLSVVQSTQAQMAEKSGDLPDISDRASEGFEDELAVGLMAIEAAQLDDINEAIERIDNGTYGLCIDCGRAVPKKRLEVLPFAKRCLQCEGESERRSRIAESQAEEEELE